MERWREEIVLRKTDLDCCQRYFQYQKEVWQKRGEGMVLQEKTGHLCYCYKQMAIWDVLEKRAEASNEVCRDKLEKANVL